jgi:hypothetical protein
VSPSDIAGCGKRLPQAEAYATVSRQVADNRWHRLEHRNHLSVTAWFY